MLNFHIEYCLLYFHSKKFVQKINIVFVSDIIFEYCHLTMAMIELVLKKFVLSTMSNISKNCKSFKQENLLRYLQSMEFSILYLLSFRKYVITCNKKNQ